MLRGYFYAKSSIEDTLAPGGFGGSDNDAQKIDRQFKHQQKSLSLIIDTTELSTLGDKILAYAIFLVNGSDSITKLNASDSRLPIIAEALLNGKWKAIEYLPSSWCGNSYHRLYLKSGEYWRFWGPVYTGNYQTKMRYRLTLPDSGFLYSNEIVVSINKSQFTKKADYTPSGLMDPYND